MNAEEIKALIPAHPVGPHRRLYLLLKSRANFKPKPVERFCVECGALVTQQNPKANRCDHCYSLRRLSESERLQALNLRDIERDFLYDGPQKKRITLDTYERHGGTY